MHIVCCPRAYLAHAALFAVIVCVLGAPLAGAAGAPAPWTQWRGEGTHQGVWGVDAPSGSALRWRFETGGQVFSSPVFHNGTVLIGSDDGWLYCLDGQTGELEWKFQTNGPVESTALVLGNRAYFGSQDGLFYCIQLPAQGGQPSLVWNYTTGDSIVSSAHRFDDSLVFGSYDGSVYRLGLDGSLVWKADTGASIWASPLLDATGGRIYIGNIQGDYYCLDLDDGSVVWNTTLANGEIYSSSCLAQGNVYVTDGMNKTLHALDAQTGATVFTMDLGKASYSTPAYADGRLYFHSFDYAWCVPAQDPDGDGAMTKDDAFWRTANYDKQGGSSPLVAGSRIIVGSDDNNLYCLDRGTGAVVWNYTTEGYIYSSPAILGSSIVFGSCDFFVYCMGDAAPGLAVEVVLDDDQITSDQRLEFEVRVRDQSGAPVEGASVLVNASSGSLEAASAATDASGAARFTFIPPPVSSRSTVELAASASKAGLPDGASSASIAVEPGNATDESGAGVKLDYTSQRMPYFALIGAVIAVNVAILFVIIRMRGALREGAK